MFYSSLSNLVSFLFGLFFSFFCSVFLKRLFSRFCFYWSPFVMLELSFEPFSLGKMADLGICCCLSFFFFDFLCSSGSGCVQCHFCVFCGFCFSLFVRLCFSYLFLSRLLFYLFGFSYFPKFCFSLLFLFGRVLLLCLFLVFLLHFCFLS